ncbi:MAG: DUF3987 domain-containing protein [Melioribacteraceae bacterium]|nr:DUF3987 domain-containing protein [Melioribacteraceae bacterium]MCF8356809.1 DUF3987 domain-containing protein [Melioribacteraceae bacterium]MCF8394266.1 DUF3987 domain-containing protein [Melioribacteraceae bacterium]MCF8418166.1 DUF3987 domain-containing protein [Melioribacteraceae bacterium]
MQNNHLLGNENIEVKKINSSKETEVRFDINRLSNTAFKRMILYYDSISSSPLEYLLTGTLASLSGAVGKNVYFKITDSMLIHLNVWAVIIGRSTIMKKTTALNIVKQDLQRIETKNFHEYKKAVSQYQRELETSGNKQSKSTIIKPIRKHILLPQDSTIESLSEILACSDRGLLTHSEFGSFLLQLNRGYSADAKQFLTTIYDVPDSYEVSRVTKENTLLERPYISILGASTIDWIKEHSTETDLRSGFFARFIYSIHNFPDKPHIPLLELSNLTKRSDRYINTREIYDYLVSINDIIELTITKDAADYHKIYDNESYKELLNSANDNELSFKARLLIYSLKFAGLIAITEQRKVVELNDMKDGILIAEYYKRNVEKLLNNELIDNKFEIKEQRILSIISKYKGKILRSDLMNNFKGKAKDLDEILTNLKEKDLIEEVKEKNQINRYVTFYRTK